MRVARYAWVIVLVVVSLLSIGTTHAQNGAYPNRPVRLVVPFSPGGISDFIGRVLADAAQEPLGGAMVVENRPGASGNIGMGMVARSAADGYVLGLASVGFASNYVLQSRIPFNPVRDFTPVLLVGSIPSVIVVHPSLPVKTLEEFIALARKHPDELAFGSSGMGTGSHLAVELFRSATGTRMTHVPYKSTAQAVPDLLAGRIHFMFDFPTTALQPIKAGKLRGIAVTTARRTPVLPDLPTVSEAGIAGFEFGTWCGLFAPAGLPAAVTEKLEASLMRALHEPVTKAKLAEQAIDVNPMKSDRFAQFLRTDIARWRSLLDAGHLARLD